MSTSIASASETAPMQLELGVESEDIVSQMHLLIDVVKSCSLLPREPSAGYELEANLYEELPEDGCFRLDEGAHALAANLTNVQGEFSCSNVEFNGSATPLRAGALDSMRKEADTFYEELDALGRKPLLSGVHLTDRWNRMGEEGTPKERKAALKRLINPGKPRYIELTESWKQDRGVGGTSFQLPGDRKPRMLSSCGPIGSLTSCQYHFAVAPGEITEALNVAFILNAPCLAPFVSGGRWMGTQRNVQDMRYFIWRQLFPQRTGVSLDKGWLTSLESHLKNQLNFSRYFKSAMEGEPKSLAERIQDFTLQSSSLWPDARLKWFPTAGGEVVFTIEARHQGTSTLEDNVAGIALWTGLMNYYLSIYGAERLVSEFGDFAYIEQNSRASATRGLGSRIMWMRSRKRVRDILLDELLPNAHEGLLAMGIPDDEAGRYLRNIEETARSGKTQASWIEDASRKYEMKLTPEELDQLLIRGILDRQRDPVHTWSPL